MIVFGKLHLYSIQKDLKIFLGWESNILGLGNVIEIITGILQRSVQQ